ncbi:TCP-1/cpn60 chaperonin family protein [Bacillota bacterium LX-D]|nr:TCP-1/cpn60 chaperonin family protein [Bacillota bacterium LX-D]
MSVKQVSENAEVDESLAALSTNVSAVRAISSAVEGTLGPKGMDTMLVDQFGGVVITNDGVTILNLMEVNHPAAKMLINIAKAQQEEIGDGTTTATIMAGSLVSAGMEQVLKGVPVAKVVEGLRLGVQEGLDFFQLQAKKIKDLKDPSLKQIALVAGRGYAEIAELVVNAANLIGQEKLLEPHFKLAETVIAQAGAQNEVFEGVIINKEWMNAEVEADYITNVNLLIIDDALEPEEVEEEALATEAGVRRYYELQNEFIHNLGKIIDLQVKLVLVDRGVSPLAEEILTDAGIVVLQRVAHKELRKAMEHCGARFIKRTGLKKESTELKKYLGKAQTIYLDQKLKQVRIIDGCGKPTASILVGAATEEVVDEMERIAKDAASAVQAAVKGGIVPGGGAVEIAAALAVQNSRQKAKGMAAYGVDCVVEALNKPFCQIVANAGYMALEKQQEVITAQKSQENIALALDCETGEITDMFELGVVDPALVKIHALKAAGEVAEAILRIDTIIRMKEINPSQETKAGNIEF